MRITFLALASVSTLLISNDAEAMFPWGKGKKNDAGATEMKPLSKSLPTQGPLELSPPTITNNPPRFQTPPLSDETGLSAGQRVKGATPSRTKPIPISSGSSRRGSAPVTMEKDLSPSSVLIGSNTLLFPMGGFAASAPPTASLLSLAFESPDGRSISSEKAASSDEDEDLSSHSDLEENDEEYSVSDAGPFIPPHVLTQSDLLERYDFVGSYPGQRPKFNRDEQF